MPVNSSVGTGCEPALTDSRAPALTSILQVKNGQRDKGTELGPDSMKANRVGKTKMRGETRRQQAKTPMRKERPAREDLNRVDLVLRIKTGRRAAIYSANTDKFRHCTWHQGSRAEDTAQQK